MKDILDDNKYSEAEGDKFFDAVGDKLRMFSEEPPQGMFERIEQTLMAAEAASKPTRADVAEEPKRVVPLWNRPFVRGVAAAMVAAMLTLVVVVALRDNAPEEIRVVAEQQSVEEPTMEQPTESEPPQQEKIAMVTSMVKAPAATSEVAVVEMDEALMAESNNAEEPSVESGSTADPTPKTTKRERRKSRRTGSSRQNQQELEEYWRAAMSVEAPQRGILNPTEVGLYAQNVGFNYGHIQRNNMANSPMMIKEQNETTGGSYTSPSLVQQNPNSNLEHFMPVTVGVTVNYALGDWFSVNSGLLYTNVYSKSDTDGSLSHYSRKRTLDYLGVPIALSLYFAEFDRWALYGRVGGTLELCINANDKSYMDGEFVERFTLDVPPLTFSLDAAVGATYALWGNVGLFGEVGCAYWNAPAGYAENYRTVQPLSLSTRFGLSFMFN